MGMLKRQSGFSATISAKLFNIDRFWQSVLAVQHPGSLPTFDLHAVNPSVKVREIKKRRRRRTLVAWAVCVAAVAVITSAFHGTLFFAAICAGGFMLMRSVLNNSNEIQKIRTAFLKVKSDWDNAIKVWEDRA